MTAKAECVAHGSAHLTLLCLVEGEVEIVVDFLIVVTLLVVDGGGHDVVLHSQYGSHSLNGTGGTQQVTGHRLRRADVEFVGSLAEYLLDGFGLGDVAHVGRGTVNVDIVDVLGLEVGIGQGTLHHELGTQSLGVGGGDVVGVGAHALANHLSVDLGTTCLGVLQFLKDETAGTLAHDESVAAGAEGA